ncbi:solute carrier family 22 member 3-like [Eupeodes corollae]|uniref:solute carrier family 22 member 3-like n=1 Tax=Eupeodes corollae TaxID=290404 RepID=UPI00249351A3|nr:solute carrier family 22 member 3-like [Eupeodes corollae]
MALDWPYTEETGRQYSKTIDPWNPQGNRRVERPKTTWSSSILKEARSQDKMASDEKSCCTKDSTESSHPFGVDDILKSIGEFGKFQRLIYLCIFCIVIFASIISQGFIFTASSVIYRCRILECDVLENSYEKSWTKFSIPKTTSGQLDKCHRYKSSNLTTGYGQNVCNAENFDQGFDANCGEDFIFRDKEVTISNDFKIFCSDEWKLAMVGTTNNLGKFFGIPLGGYVSDRYGRRFVLKYGSLISAVLGSVQSFSPNYYIFVILGFLDNLFGSILYTTVYILGLEIVGPRVRVLTCSLISMCGGIGGFLLALTAKNFRNWRLIQRIFYFPAFGFIALPWIIPESFRWLLSQGEEVKAVEVLKTIARTNKRKLSESCVEKLLKMYFGLNLNVALLGGNKYNSYMFVSLIEIPGMLLPFLTMDRYGRRRSLFGFMVFSGICIIAMTYVNSEFVNLKLVLYLLGKMTISASFQTLYFFTSEIFPTSVRNSLLSFCSMVGRLGSMAAPLTPLMSNYYASAPQILFASCAILSGSMALFLPETKNSVLPTTLEEAKKIGQKETNIEQETEEKLLEAKA